MLPKRQIQLIGRSDQIRTAQRMVAGVPRVRQWVPVPLPQKDVIPIELPRIPPKSSVPDYSLEFLTRSGVPVRMTQATPRDYDRVMDFMVREFHSREPISNYLKYTPAEFKEYAEPIVDDALKRPYSFIVWDQRTKAPCAMTVSSVQPNERLGDQIPEVPTEISDLVDKVKCSTARLGVLVGLVKFLDTVTPHFINDGSKEFIRYELGTCLPKYTRNGLLKELLLSTVKAAAADGITHHEGMCSAAGSKVAFEWLGSKPVYTVPYLPLTLRGKSVFPTPLYDGATALTLVIGKSDEILRKHENDAEKPKGRKYTEAIEKAP